MPSSKNCCVFASFFLLEWEARPVNAIKREQARSYFIEGPFEEANFFDLGDSNYVLVLRNVMV